MVFELRHGLRWGDIFNSGYFLSSGVEPIPVNHMAQINIFTL